MPPLKHPPIAYFREEKASSPSPTGLFICITPSIRYPTLEDRGEGDGGLTDTKPAQGDLERLDTVGLVAHTLSIVERAAAGDDLTDTGSGGNDAGEQSAIQYSSTVTVRASSTSKPTDNSKSSTTKNDNSDSEETSILAQAVATTNLSWWQLFALIFGCTLALAVGGWAWWRHRRKKQKDKEKKKNAAIEEDRRRVQSRKERELMQLTKAAVGGRRGKPGGGKRSSDSYDDGEEGDSWSESDDSVSDGGTIRASRTRRRRGRRDRDQRRYGRSRRSRGGRRGDSELEDGTETDWSDWSRYHARGGYSRRGDKYHNGRDRDRDRDRRRYAEDYDSPYFTRKSFRRGRGRDRDRAITTPSTAPTETPTPVTAKRRKRDTFRDSVFSSYNSMKNAAVRLKYVEAKVKLKKQLEEEERVENRRKEKIREANREIEEYNRVEHERTIREKKENNRSLLIPPAPRQPTRKSSSDSNYSDISGLPYEKPARNISKSKSNGETKWSPTNNHRQLTPPKSAMKTPTRTGMGSRQNTDNSLDGQISHLLGGGGGKNNTLPVRNGTPPKTHQEPSPPPAAAVAGLTGARDDSQNQSQSEGRKGGWFTNAFQSNWLSHPAQPPAQAAITSSPEPYGSDTQRSDSRSSVYLPVTHPKERPVIPKGGLAPAPPPRARISGESTEGRAAYGMSQSRNQSQNDRNDMPHQPEIGTGAAMAAVRAGGGGAGSKWTNRLRQKRM
ncbi:hypothetical protein IAU59_007486 [Kwoniella sp. CBS 9459]